MSIITTDDSAHSQVLTALAQGAGRYGLLIRCAYLLVSREKEGEKERIRKQKRGRARGREVVCDELACCLFLVIAKWNCETGWGRRERLRSGMKVRTGVPGEGEGVAVDR